MLLSRGRNFNVWGKILKYYSKAFTTQMDYYPKKIKNIVDVMRQQTINRRGGKQDKRNIYSNQSQKNSIRQKEDRLLKEVLRTIKGASVAEAQIACYQFSSTNIADRNNCF